MTAAWNSGAASDTGLLRERNEDRFWVDAEHGIFLVVDGIGGCAAGDVAAEIAVDSIRQSLAAFDGPADACVRAAILRANNRIFEEAAQHDEFAGMACVLTLAVVKDGRLTVGHVGDSRLYLIWNGAIRKITSDHSPVGEDEDAGELSEKEAMVHPRRNVVSRDVGSKPRVEDDRRFVEIRQCRFRRDAALLLCSDGLTDQLTAAQVLEIVEDYAGDADAVAVRLVEAANAAGGRDNITALFVAGGEFRGHRFAAGTATRARMAPARVRARRSALSGRAAFLAYGIIIGMLIWALLRIAR